jgi:hypothetical protein
MQTVRALNEELEREQLLPSDRLSLQRWRAWLDWWQSLRGWLVGNRGPADSEPPTVDYLALVARQEKTREPVSP